MKVYLFSQKCSINSQIIQQLEYIFEFVSFELIFLNLNFFSKTT